MKAPKFLQTFAAHVATAKLVPHGVNGANFVQVESELIAALGNGETATLTLPDGVDKGLVPLLAIAWSNAATRLAQAITITSHNPTTGVTVLTAPTAGVSDNSTVVVVYGPAVVGT